jgi:protein-L-isoaspartate(D-aspartate) O-methyltransferase
VNQLANGGKMAIPVGKWDQEMLVVEKDSNGHVTKKSVMGVRYVPLVNPSHCK